ncbi:MAG TPA: hypothetical protein VLH15_04385 [Dehalococcoidales bacterium]|nr:hypothetical protein [Dehalococcoidales bacterium]
MKSELSGYHEETLEVELKRSEYLGDIILRVIRSKDADIPAAWRVFLLEPPETDLTAFWYRITQMKSPFPFNILRFYLMTRLTGEIFP